MTSAEKIKTGFERSIKALTLKPSLGQSTGISRARIVDGLTCEVKEGKWTLRSDMPEVVGGNGSAPTPGVYGRAALGSCLAIAYMMRAARMDVKFDALVVEVQADYDDGALFGTSAVSPGYLQVRYIVSVQSEAPAEKILEVLDEADRHSPYLNIFSKPQECIREVLINTQT